MKLSISHREWFSAAHRLHNPAWSDEKNSAVFGLCNHPNYHGHNYEVVVTISGNPNATSNDTLNSKRLGALVNTQVIQRFNYKNLNLDIDLFKQVNPTAENIAIAMWEILRPHIEAKYDLKILLYETERNFVEYPTS